MADTPWARNRWGERLVRAAGSALVVGLTAQDLSKAALTWALLYTLDLGVAVWARQPLPDDPDVARAHATVEISGVERLPKRARAVIMEFMDPRFTDSDVESEYLLHQFERMHPLVIRFGVSLCGLLSMLCMVEPRVFPWISVITAGMLLMLFVRTRLSRYNDQRRAMHDFERLWLGASWAGNVGFCVAQVRYGLVTGIGMHIMVCCGVVAAVVAFFQHILVQTPLPRYLTLLVQIASPITVCMLRPVSEVAREGLLLGSGFIIGELIGAAFEVKHRLAYQPLARRLEQLEGEKQLLEFEHLRLLRDASCRSAGGSGSRGRDSHEADELRSTSEDSSVLCCDAVSMGGSSLPSFASNSTMARLADWEREREDERERERRQELHEFIAAKVGDATSEVEDKKTR
jgi:hypothetical protein